jgi:HTH-type transcriptional regulator / antitoxin HigA
MSPKIIKTEPEYRQALAHVESLMDAEPGSAEESALELWALLVERYEEMHFPIESPDPVDAIKFRMAQEGLRQKDLEKYFSSKSRVSEVLNHKRPLSLGMIRALHKGLGIPASVLVQ